MYFEIACHARAAHGSSVGCQLGGWPKIGLLFICTFHLSDYEEFIVENLYDIAPVGKNDHVGMDQARVQDPGCHQPKFSTG